MKKMWVVDYIPSYNGTPYTSEPYETEAEADQKARFALAIFGTEKATVRQVMVETFDELEIY
jgi:hypothetical protein